VSAIPNLGRSWWLLDALTDPALAGDPAPALRTDTTADVVILGGGYTGMWAAWFLTERAPGINVVLLEQDICGGGPSGRNGGFCDGWWGDISDLTATFGDDGARSLLTAVAPSPGEIGAWCEDNDVDAWFRVGGELAVSTNPSHDGGWEPTVRAAERLGLGDHYRVLLPEEVQARCASPTFRGGLLTPDGATVQPARLARGLRRVLMHRGVRIFEDSPVSRFGSGSPAIAETAGGIVRAGQAVNALGAWATTWKRFRPVLTIRGSYMVITEPVPDLVEALGWTAGEAIRDLRSSIHYLRTTPDGRIAFGLGGLQRGLARQVRPSMSFDESFVRKTADDLAQMFPTFADVPLTAGWGGPINVSGLTIPFFGTSGRHGNVHHGLGYTGNGVGPSHLGGKILASLGLGADDELTRLPLVTREPKPFPPEPIRSPGMLVANAAIWRKDDLEDAGRSAGPGTRLVATMPRRLGYTLGPR
jgi:glycine/D-amino acid oxidase-like deaminating enzyme